jgi:hypothetical protein
MGVAAIAIAGLALTAVSTGVAVYGGIQQRQAAKNTAEYEAQVARNNQIIQQRAAADVRARGAETVQEIRERGRVRQQLLGRETRGLIGIQRAALAAQGVVVDQDSALELTTDTAGIGEYERQVVATDTARAARSASINAERAAYEYETRGYSYGAEADLARLRGWMPDTSLGTALSGLGSIASRYIQYDQAGVFN